MLEHSVLARTGQLWKVQSAICAVLVGGAALVYGIASDTGEGSGLLWIVAGLLLALGGLAFACFGVSCPKCGARWVWMAVSQRSAGAYGTWLVALARCPKCDAR
jgi:hypothetical protein